MYNRGMSEAPFPPEGQQYRIVVVHKSGARIALPGDSTLEAATEVRDGLLSTGAYQDVIIKPLAPGELPAWKSHFNEWLAPGIPAAPTNPKSDPP